MTIQATSQSETGMLERVLVQHARDAFQQPEKVADEWSALGFTAEPDLQSAIREYETFVDHLRQIGARIERLPASDDLTLDSMYVRDASVVCDTGAILCRMGKLARRAESDAQERCLRAIGVPILGRIEPPGQLEGGDFVWLDGRTAAVGLGYRTNREGVRQLRHLLGTTIDELLEVPLPHWRGPGDVFHLMSMISPVDRDLSVVYSPLMPVEFRTALVDRGISLVEVPDEEFLSMGANVLALGPRRCLMVEGNPITRGRLQKAGADVVEYSGLEISMKGGGGPTCLTRPLTRNAQATSTSSGK